LPCVRMKVVLVKVVRERLILKNYVPGSRHFHAMPARLRSR